MMSIAATALLWPAVAAAPLTIGFFDPYAPFASPLDRVQFVERVASTLATQSRQPVDGKAYSKSTDVARHLRSGQLQLAIVAPQFYTQHQSTLTPLFIGTRNGKSLCRYSLYVSKRSRARSLRGLKGAKLALVGSSQDDRRFVFNEVLRGEIRSETYFAKVINVPDLAGAVGTVEFRGADAFFGPELDYNKYFKRGVLRRLAEVGDAPCTIVVVDKRLPTRERRDLQALVSSSLSNLEPTLRRIGLDSLTDIDGSTISELMKAVKSDTAEYARAVPMLLMPVEPDKDQILQRIQDLDSMLPEPSRLVVERDGL